MAIAKKTVRSAKAPVKSTRAAREEAVEPRRTKKVAEAAPEKTTRAERMAAREAAKAAAAKAERIAAKKAAAAKAAKPSRRSKPEPEEVEVESSQQILLTYVAEITGKKVTMTDTSYNVDGVEILRAQVVAMVGKTFFYRNTISLGTVADTQLVKGLTCVNTVEGDKVVLFDPTCIQLLTVDGGAAEAEAEAEGDDDETEVEDDDEDDETEVEDDDETDEDDEDGEGDDDEDGEGDDDAGGDDDDDFEF